MGAWDTLDLEDCPQFQLRVTRLVQHVYKQTGRYLKGGGDSLHYNQIWFSFIDSQPHTTTIQIAEGHDAAPGADMVS